MKFKKMHVYIYSYFFLLYIAAVFLFDFSDYNYLVNLFFGLLSFFLFPYIISMRKMLVMLAVFLLIEIITAHVSNIYYFITDFCIGLFILFITQKLKLVNRIEAANYLKIFYYGSLFYLFLILIAVFTPSLTVDGRFAGLGFSCNITSSIVLILCIFLCIYRRNIFVLLFVTIVISILLYFAKTRALLLVLPLLLYYFQQKIGTKTTSIILLPLAIFLIVSNFSVLEDTLRLNADDSFNTRASLYLYMLDELRNSYFVIPHGFNVDQLYIDNLLRQEGFPVHNDFLKYWFNYGIFFWAFLFALYQQLKIFFRNKIEMLLIFFALSGNALQNALFSLYILIPFMFILLALKIENRENQCTYVDNKLDN